MPPNQHTVWTLARELLRDMPADVASVMGSEKLAQACQLSEMSPELQIQAADGRGQCCNGKWAWLTWRASAAASIANCTKRADRVESEGIASFSQQFFSSSLSTIPATFAGRPSKAACCSCVVRNTDQFVLMDLGQCSEAPGVLRIEVAANGRCTKQTTASQ